MIDRVDKFGHLVFYLFGPLGWYAEFLLRIDLQTLLGKATARLNLKIMLKSLHTSPGLTGALVSNVNFQ